jgi:hypothetical protein
MIYLVIAIIVLGVVVAVFEKIFHGKDDDEPIVQAPSSSCATCNGIDPNCEQVCMMEAATKDIEYFDDEELDTYKGRPSDQYSDAEIEQFSEVLYTLKPDEVKPWGRSLTLRGINLPDQLKDEFIALA